MFILVSCTNALNWKRGTYPVLGRLPSQILSRFPLRISLNIVLLLLKTTSMKNMPTKYVQYHFMDRVLLTILLEVIQKIGLCIGFYDLLESSDGLIGHGTGLVNVNGQLP
jgi:hypothetical protein